MCVIRFICYATMGNQHQINMKGELLPSSPYGYNSNNPKESRVSSSKITHVVLFIIVILVVLFFISGLLHLLARFLTKRPSPAQSNRGQEYSSSDTLQRQLHHLFDLHDSGLDQAFIDALPVFPFKEISGPKEPFDCAVCLCEFSETDELRLLPICSHAFHINCIDTWLLSNSTCPICRGTPLIPGFSYANPVFDYDDIREEEEQGSLAYAENGYSNVRRVGIEENRSVFPVRLGKFRRLNDAGGVRDESSSSSALDARRCYSMGSYQYVVGNAVLRVTLSQGQMGRGPNLVEGVDQACSSSTLDARRCYSMDSHQYVVGNVEHGVASSQDKMGRGRAPNFVEGADQECSGSTLDARRCYSMGSHDTLNQGQTGRGLNHVALDGSGEGREICVGSKSSSYSVSKIWLWSKKGEFQVKNQPSPGLVDLSWIHRTEGR